MFLKEMNACNTSLVCPAPSPHSTTTQALQPPPPSPNSSTSPARTILSASGINYLCTYDLYGPLRNTFDAGSIHYEGKWEGGLGPGNQVFFGVL
jgi:hypothetical protein